MKKADHFLPKVAAIVLLSAIGWVVVLLASLADSFPTPGEILAEWPLVSILLGTLIAGQTLLLLGAPHWKPPSSDRPPKRLWFSAVGAGAVAALIFTGTVGLFASLVYLLTDQNYWEPLTHGNWIFLWLGLPWLGWTALFGLTLTKNAAQWPFGRLYRYLVGGTVLELATTVPVDVFVRRRANCYCEHGSFWALGAGIGAAGILFGPGIVLLLLKRRLAWLHRHEICLICGYNLQGLTENRCPECGKPFIRPPTPIT